MRAQVRHVLLVATVLATAAPPLPAQLPRRYAGFAVGATRSVLTQHPEATEPRWGATLGLVTGVVTFDHYFLEFAPSWTRMGGGDIRLDYGDLTLVLGGAFRLLDSALVLRPFVGVTMLAELGCRAPGAVCEATISPTWAVPVGLSVLHTRRDGDFIGGDVRYVAGISHVFSRTSIIHGAWQLRMLFGFPLVRREASPGRR